MEPEKKPRDSFFGDYGLEAYRKDALMAAKDFNYGPEVAQAIRDAKTMGDIQRIMINARHKKYGKY